MDRAASSTAKRSRNHRHYAKSRQAQDHVLLRLDRGGRAQLDEAAAAASLPRAAFTRLLLPALLGCVGPRLSAIEAARGRSGQSLSRFLAAAIDDALVRAALEAGAPPPAAAMEFDELFRRG